MIPLLTGVRYEAGQFHLSLDNRFGATFPDESTARLAAHLIANALAIGQQGGSVTLEAQTDWTRREAGCCAGKASAVVFPQSRR